MGRGRNPNNGTQKISQKSTKLTNLCEKDPQEDVGDIGMSSRAARSTRRSLTTTIPKEIKQNVETNAEVKVKRGRGRPRRIPIVPPSLEVATATTSSSPVEISNDNNFIIQEIAQPLHEDFENNFVERTNNKTINEQNCLEDGSYEIILENEQNVISVIEIVDESDVVSNVQNEEIIEHDEQVDSSSTPLGSLDCNSSSVADDESGTFIMSTGDEDSQVQSDCALHDENSAIGDRDDSSHEQKKYYFHVESMSQDDFVRLQISSDEGTQNSQVSQNVSQDSVYGTIKLDDDESIIKIDEEVRNHMENVNEVIIPNVPLASSTIETIQLHKSPIPKKCDASPDMLQIHTNPKMKTLRTYQNRRKSRTLDNSTYQEVMQRVEDIEIDINKKIIENQLGNDLKDKLNVSEINIDEQELSIDGIERRRSQRKKTIRYDVRYLLKKNKKNTKVQIDSPDGSNLADSSQSFNSFTSSECFPLLKDSNLSSGEDDFLNSTDSKLDEKIIRGKHLWSKTEQLSDESHENHVDDKNINKLKIRENGRIKDSVVECNDEHENVDISIEKTQNENNIKNASCSRLHNFDSSTETKTNHIELENELIELNKNSSVRKMKNSRLKTFNLRCAETLEQEVFEEDTSKNIKKLRKQFPNIETESVSDVRDENETISLNSKESLSISNTFELNEVQSNTFCNIENNDLQSIKAVVKQKRQRRINKLKQQTEEIQLEDNKNILESNIVLNDRKTDESVQLSLKQNDVKDSKKMLSKINCNLEEKKPETCNIVCEQISPTIKQKPKLENFSGINMHLEVKLKKLPSPPVLLPNLTQSNIIPKFVEKTYNSIPETVEFINTKVGENKLMQEIESIISSDLRHFKNDKSFLNIDSNELQLNEEIHENDINYSKMEAKFDILKDEEDIVQTNENEIITDISTNTLHVPKPSENDQIVQTVVEDQQSEIKDISLKEPMQMKIDTKTNTFHQSRFMMDKKIDIQLCTDNNELEKENSSDVKMVLQDENEMKIEIIPEDIVVNHKENEIMKEICEDVIMVGKENERIYEGPVTEEILPVGVEENSRSGSVESTPCYKLSAIEETSTIISSETSLTANTLSFEESGESRDSELVSNGKNQCDKKTNTVKIARRSLKRLTENTTNDSAEKKTNEKIINNDSSSDSMKTDEQLKNVTTSTNIILQNPGENTNKESSFILTEDNKLNAEQSDQKWTEPEPNVTEKTPTEEENVASIRRSHRIKTISKTKSQSVGRGLVRDKERFEKMSADATKTTDEKLQKSTITQAELEAQNAKFLSDMEERLSQFNVIKENEYRCERIISKEAKKMTCDCFLTRDEEDRGELGCGEDCLNRLLMIECSPKCTVGERCTNRRFQKNQYAPCKVFRTEKKGFGIMADGEVPSGDFIMEYVGEVLNSKQFAKRANVYSLDKNKHYYFMALRSDAIIDATSKGNISRFINHSCDPNAETQKWTVNGELRIGFFSKKRILPGEEITFDYQFQRYGKEAQKCFCESANCRGWIGEEPESEEEDEEGCSESDEDIDEKKRTTEDIDSEKNKTAKAAKNNVPSIKQLGTSEKDFDEKNEGKLTSITIGLEDPKGLKTPQIDSPKVTKRRGRMKKEFRLNKQLDSMEDPDLEDEIESLMRSGLKNQAHTLRLSRLMVRAKLYESRVRLLGILCKGEMPCRRLFLDYHGLRLLHGWMTESETKNVKKDLDFRLLIVETLQILPIPNKTMLKDSKVYHTIQGWSNDKEIQISPNDSPTDSGTPIPNENSTTIQKIIIEPLESTENYNPVKVEITRISTKLIATWENLPEVFRIPKRERIEQMKEHEREADRQYKALNLVDEENYKFNSNKDRFGKTNNVVRKSYKWVRDKFEKNMKPKEYSFKDIDKINQDQNLSKVQRRQLFAAKVARDEAERRLAEGRREFEIKCKFYGLDSKTILPRDMPFCVNPATGQWYTEDKRKISTPPSHAHIQVPSKPQSTDPKDYRLSSMDLPPFWKFGIDQKGRIYYYHIKIRIPQWELPIKILPLTDPRLSGIRPGTSTQIASSTSNNNKASGESSEDSDSADSTNENKDDGDVGTSRSTEDVEARKSRKRDRYNLLVQERTISPRREEDRIYNQIEMKRYRENKEKIRRRKEEIKRRKVQLLKQQIEIGETATTTPTTMTDNESQLPVDTATLPLPIQDYLISSDEEEKQKSDCDSPLMEKFVHVDKIVDELDALTKERPLKRPLLIKDRSEYKKRIKTDEWKKVDEISQKPNKNKKDGETNSKYLAKKAKEKFRSDIAGIIVHHLTPYRKDSCRLGKITSNDDFKHLARKLTHFVMIKELKHCDSTGQKLIVTESVKNKSREFIKKYMAKYGETYIRPENDPEFKEIPSH